MKCKNCGNELQVFEQYCPHCGEYVKKNTPDQNTTNETKKTYNFINDNPTKLNKDYNKLSFFDLIKKIFNFDNIGNKIKTFSTWWCWIQICLILVISPIMFIVSLIIPNLRPMWWVWIILLLFGPLLTWVNSWFLYSVGNFIENDEKRTVAQTQIAEKINNEQK